MRYADFLVDLAAVVTASRSVASKHLELRAGQLDRYGKTSSIVRSLRQQKQHVGAHSQPGQASEHSYQQTSSGSAEATPEASEVLSEQHDRYLKLTQASRATDIPEFSFKLSPEKVPRTPDQSVTDKGFGGAVKHDAVEDQSDVPPGIDLNIFHTGRGSQLLEIEQQEALGKRQPVSPPTRPSWFKDFGHDSVTTKTAAPSAPLVAEKSVLGEQEDVTPQSNEEPQVDGKPDVFAPKASIAEQQNDRMAAEVLAQAEAIKPQDIEVTPSAAPPEAKTSAYVLRESKVPSTRFGRLWNYGGLAAGMLGGAISESFSRGLGGGGSGSVLLSAGNMERLVSKLSRMRGAALKMGQLLSFQDTKMLPAPIHEVLQRVQDRADYMPGWQRDRVMASSLGSEWRDLFDEFEEKPIAAASIGQVHRATLKSNGQKVAVKVQFPGVADSINSDLDNLSMLLLATKMLPRGLYLNKTIDNARTELGWECDYEREAKCGRRYGELLADEPDVFAVPKIFPEASGKHVLTMEFMDGVGVTRIIKTLTQEQRDWIGTQILRLCLREIVEFHFMQTDPNWTNFLYNASTNKLELLDFGASREYPVEFVSQYVNLLAAAARSDRQAVKELSESLGYLTGHESKIMLDAHIASVLTLAEPFLQSAPEVYDFSDQTITERVKSLIPVMIRERLAPPPEETYSLHRKLSGAFLLCAKLGSQVRCRELFRNALDKAEFEVRI
ncbi:ABC1 family-domain-containing protein [Xylariales sp. PMI_506]|nr:ABC1 family-domain-containing protein [Xylariales sp. PMI_506]